VILVILLANVVTLVLALLAGLIYQRYHNREVITRDLLAQGEIVGANSTAALIFNDAGTAAEMLAPLKSERHVLAAALYLPDRNCLAAFGTVPEQLAEKDAAAAAVFREEGPHLALIQPVMLKARKVGTLYLRFDYRAMQAEGTESFLGTMSLVLPISLVLAFILSSFLQRVISVPIEKLSETARGVTSQRDYSLRAQRRGEDEIGALTVAFNQMLERIQDQDLALRASEARYRLLFESNPFPMYVFDRNTFQFLAVNDATVERYGYSRDEFLRMTIKQIRPAADWERLVASVQGGPELNHAGEWQHLTKEGCLIDVDVTTHALEFDGHPARMVLAADITERKKVDAAWHHRLKMEKLVSEISARFINLPAREIDGGIRWMLQLLGQTKQVDLSWVGLFSSDGMTARCHHQWSDIGLETFPGWPAEMACDRLPWWSEAIRSLKPILLTSVSDIPAHAAAEVAFLAGLEIRSVAVVPILFGGRAIGALGLACRREQKIWAEDAITVLELVAQIVVSALERKRAGEELEAMTNQLVAASHQAGMAEVATGVLHNVGNVLNSVNVSTTLIQGSLRRSEVATLTKIAGILNEHASDLAEFLTQDARGQAVPALIKRVAGQIAQEHAQLEKEHSAVARNIEHIKEIVAMQQSYAKVSGLLEEVSLAALLDDAVAINQAGLGRHRVTVLRQYEEVPPVMTDKHKVLQILINLINNAKYALDGARRSDKQLTLGICAVNGSRVKVSVQDNGIGIPAENLTRIFSHGFTTRSKGHGFGLHSGANAAKEMGGALSAASDGPDRGAIFTLELPLQAEKK